MSNQSKLALLRPKVAQMAQSLIDQCKSQLGVNLLVTSTYRTVDEQNTLYAQGRTTPGQIVTNAKGGYSMHQYHIAFDVCPVKEDGTFDWNYDFNKIGKIGEAIGLEHGDRGYVDLPHFQCRMGYSLEDFVNGKIDWSKFELSTNTTNKMEENTTGEVVTTATPQKITIKSVTIDYVKHIDGEPDTENTATEKLLTQAICDALKPLFVAPEYNVTVVAENYQA